jgi:hypothetical protein
MQPNSKTTKTTVQEVMLKLMNKFHASITDACDEMRDKDSLLEAHHATPTKL